MAGLLNDYRAREPSLVNYAEVGVCGAELPKLGAGFAISRRAAAPCQHSS